MREECLLGEIAWKGLNGLAFLVALIGMTAEGTPVHVLVGVLKVTGVIAILLFWAVSLLCVGRGRYPYDVVVSLFAFVASFLLLTTYLRVEVRDEWGVEPLRLFTFSALTHLLIILIPRRTRG